MAAFGISDGVTPLPAQAPYIDCSGLTGGEKRWVAKLPDGTFRQFYLQISSMDVPAVEQVKADAENRAARSTSQATASTAAALTAQAILDLANAGDSVER